MVLWNRASRKLMDRCRGTIDVGFFIMREEIDLYLKKRSVIPKMISDSSGITGVMTN